MGVTPAALNVSPQERGDYRMRPPVVNLRMNTQSRAGLAFLILAALACSSTSPRSAPVVPEPAYDRELGLASFDSAWSRISATYYDTTFRGLDWKALRDSLRPQAKSANSMKELRGVVRSIFTRLGESHFVLVPGEVASSLRDDEDTNSVAQPGYAGIELRVSKDQLLITRIERGSAAEEAGLKAGWQLVRLGDVDANALVKSALMSDDARVRRAAEVQASMRAEAAGFGALGEEVTVVARDESGKTRELHLKLGAWDGEIVRYGPLPPQYFTFDSQRFTDSEGCTGVVRFSDWMPPLLPRLERAMEELRACRGIVLDLRGNSGGVAAMVMGVSGFFLDKPDTLGIMTTRVGTLRYIANPRFSNRKGESVTPYSGALAILLDQVSASTTEIFAKAMHDLGRARLFGDTTAGQALPATMTKLPNADLLVHVIADFHSPSGARVEAHGVVPDSVIPVRPADLLARVDAPLAAALSWVADSTAGRRTASGTTLVPRP